MSSTKQFVCVIALDFSEAFHAVKHEVLFNKISFLEILDEVYNWIQDFFVGHTHSTSFNGLVSYFAEIFAALF